MIKKLLILAVLPLLALSVSAQEKDNSPKQWDVTFSTNLGYNSYASVSALPGTLTNYEATALSTDWSNKKLMVGFEVGVFVHDFWKLSLAAGGNLTKNPGYSELPGTMNPSASLEDNLGEIPSYRAVANRLNMNYNVTLGFDRYFKIKNVPNFYLFTGLRAGFAHAFDTEKYDEYTSMGFSMGEAWNLRGAVAFGAEYFATNCLYLGLQVEPFAYTYNLTSYRPQEGLSPLRADSNNFSFLAAPTLKIGFKF